MSAVFFLVFGDFIKRSISINILENVKIVIISTRNPIKSDFKNSLVVRFAKSSG
jgi:hypothetical protein